MSNTENSIEKTSKTKMMVLTEDLNKANRRIRVLEGLLENKDRLLKSKDKTIKKLQDNPKGE